MMMSMDVYTMMMMIIIMPYMTLRSLLTLEHPTTAANSTMVGLGECELPENSRSHV